jgi:hypothetical protein
MVSQPVAADRSLKAILAKLEAAAYVDPRPPSELRMAQRKRRR